jgi:hypothetical protein
MKKIVQGRWDHGFKGSYSWLSVSTWGLKISQFDLMNFFMWMLQDAMQGQGNDTPPLHTVSIIYEHI